MYDCFVPFSHETEPTGHPNFADVPDSVIGNANSPANLDVVRDISDCPTSPPKDAQSLRFLRCSLLMNEHGRLNF